MRLRDAAWLIALIFYVAWRAATGVGPWWLTAVSCSVGILIGFVAADLIERRRNRRKQ